MFEEVNTVNEVQEQVVDAQPPEEVTSEVAEEAEGTPEAAEAEPPARAPQTQEENHQFAELRRRHEAQLNQQQAEYEQLMSMLHKYGYEGSPKQVADILAAQQEGMTLEEYQQRQAEDQRRVEELLERDPRYQQALRNEAELREKNNRHIREKDAAAINAAFPNAKVTDPRELGPRFVAMMRAGVDPVDAYAVMQMADKAAEQPTPPDIGPVNGGASQDKDYYTNEELDSMTLEDLMKNPKKVAKATRSMLRNWKNEDAGQNPAEREDINHGIR